ncbi:MAG: carboxypeptidase-like regulatory domain-containing protein [Acidobacteriota bacterium]|nr:carboxypeptidase-like regulatory domain-containing protein [Acidobacteriota bacterium]
MSTINFGRLTLATGLLMCFAAMNVLAQSASSTINGTVHDSSGAAVPQAQVTITNQGTGLKVEAQSGSDGGFLMTGLASGTYEVTVVKSGFQSFAEKDVFVGPAVVRSVDATLSLGQVSTTVTVEASAAQVQTTTSQFTSFVAQQQVEELPLNGRNYQSLSALMPGVVNLGAGSAGGQGGFNTSNTMSINGMGTSGTLYELDGVWNMNTGNMTQTTILPNPDSIQEVRTLQSNISAKYTLLGSSIVLVATRSGQRDFHGSAWEYFRNDALDARNFFSPSVLPLKQNIFGGTLGGPVFIPGLYHRDKSKTFFFFSDQYTDRHIGSTQRGATPTADMRNGLFTDPITDPLTGALFPQNAAGQYVIPSNRINPNSLTLLNALAQLPNNPGGGFLNFLNPNPEVVTQNDIQIRGDHNVNDKIHLMGEYFDTRQADALPSEEWAGSPFTTNRQTFATRSKLAEAQATVVISPTMVNQFSLGMNNAVFDLGVNGLVYRNQIPSFSENLPYNGFLSDRLPDINFSGGYSSIGITQTQPLIHASDLEDTLTDDWSWIKGAHSIEAGLNVVFSTKRQNAFSQSNGTFMFSGKFTGDPIADYLLGDAASFTQANTERRPYIHGTIISPYITDSWKVSRRVTINYGLRLMHMPLPHDQIGYGSAFVPSLFNPANAPIVNANGSITPTPGYNPLNGLVINGLNGVPLNYTDKHNYYFAPNAGFAWDVFGDGKTSLRGGFGVSYARVFTGADCTYGCISNPPFEQNITLNDTNFPNPVGAGTASPPAAPALSNLNFDNRAVSVYSFSLTAEHQFGNWLVSVGGAGDQVRHLAVGLDSNQPFPSGGYNYNPSINTGSFEYLYGPYQGYGGISTSTSGANANWTGMLVSARHSVGHGLFISGSYTWSHGLSEVFGQSMFGTSGTQDSYNVRSSYGNSAVDVRHLLAFSYIYDLPFLKNRKGFVGSAFGGWKYVGIVTLQSGLPQTPGLSTANTGLAQRPDVNGKKLTYPKTVNEWFDTSIYSAPPYGFFGNAGVGTIRGPGLINFDMGLYKDFRIRERNVIQFRSEFFNVFNHTNFSGISTSVGSGDFGQVTSALDPRIIEFSLRYHF